MPVLWIFSISLLIFRINRAKGNVMPAVGNICPMKDCLKQCPLPTALPPTPFSFLFVLSNGLMTLRFQPVQAGKLKTHTHTHTHLEKSKDENPQSLGNILFGFQLFSLLFFKGKQRPRVFWGSRFGLAVKARSKRSKQSCYDDVGYLAAEK